MGQFSHCPNASLCTRPTYAERSLREHEIFGNQRFLLQTSLGAMPHADVLRSIELLGTQVAPHVRKATADSSPVTAQPGRV